MATSSKSQIAFINLSSMIHFDEAFLCDLHSTSALAPPVIFDEPLRGLKRSPLVVLTLDLIFYLTPYAHLRQSLSGIRESWKKIQSSSKCLSF